jgi:hypothetical protein
MRTVAHHGQTPRNTPFRSLGTVLIWFGTTFRAVGDTVSAVGDFLMSSRDIIRRTASTKAENDALNVHGRG